MEGQDKECCQPVGTSKRWVGDVPNIVVTSSTTAENTATNTTLPRRGLRIGFIADAPRGSRIALSLEHAQTARETGSYYDRIPSPTATSSLHPEHTNPQGDYTVSSQQQDTHTGFTGEFIPHGENSHPLNAEEAVPGGQQYAKDRRTEDKSKQRKKEAKAAMELNSPQLAQGARRDLRSRDHRKARRESQVSQVEGGPMPEQRQQQLHYEYEILKVTNPKAYREKVYEMKRLAARPQPEPVEVSYDDAIAAINKETGPLLMTLRNLPDRSISFVLCDPKGKALALCDINLTKDVDLTWLVSWLQVFIDKWSGHNDHPEVLVMSSIKVLVRGREECRHYPPLKGTAFNYTQQPNIGEFSGFFFVKWNVHDSQMEEYLRVYRSMLQMGSAELNKPILNVHTIGLPIDNAPVNLRDRSGRISAPSQYFQIGDTGTPMHCINHYIATGGLMAYAELTGSSDGAAINHRFQTASGSGNTASSATSTSDPDAGSRKLGVGPGSRWTDYCPNPSFDIDQILFKVEDFPETRLNKNTGCHEIVSPLQLDSVAGNICAIKHIYGASMSSAATLRGDMEAPRNTKAPVPYYTQEQPARFREEHLRAKVFCEDDDEIYFPKRDQPTSPPNKEEVMPKGMFAPRVFQHQINQGAQTLQPRQQASQAAGRWTDSSMPSFSHFKPPIKCLNMRDSPTTETRNLAPAPTSRIMRPDAPEFRGGNFSMGSFSQFAAPMNANAAGFQYPKQFDNTQYHSVNSAGFQYFNQVESEQQFDANFAGSQQGIWAAPRRILPSQYGSITPIAGQSPSTSCVASHLSLSSSNIQEDGGEAAKTGGSGATSGVGNFGQAGFNTGGHKFDHFSRLQESARAGGPAPIGNSFRSLAQSGLPTGSAFQSESARNEHIAELNQKIHSASQGQARSYRPERCRGLGDLASRPVVGGNMAPGLPYGIPGCARTTSPSKDSDGFPLRSGGLEAGRGTARQSPEQLEAEEAALKAIVDGFKRQGQFTEDDSAVENLVSAFQVAKPESPKEE
ncbi:hypothetical protein BJ878DRAFT_552171 [Calycina marina]|uniref:Uncharacterized protein n=1 Tax=Calycina marina TaxID=1763456 RepID=A0A9P7Z9V3_9HELO|nr:hypothetical protein BJ878DRAFT_552171 [Calycina marina]